MSSLNDLPCLGCDTQGGCGTGTGNWPKPGDPDNNSVLKATPAFGGVDVEWTFPQTNPFAVAHTRLFRAYSSDFSAASLLEIVGGNFFYDKNTSEVPIKYYYWIQFVSVNGTYGDVIGPASAMPKPTIEQMIEMLTGKIDEGVLAQSLKQEIDRIELNAQDIIKEANDRFTANQALTDALAQVQNNVDGAVTYINEEIVNRVEGQDALLKRINTLAVGNGDLAAALLTEQEARIEGDKVLARDITTLYAKNSDNEAGLIAERQARVDADSALASEQTTIKASVGANTAAITQEATARANADTALGTRIDQLAVSNGNAMAAIKTEELARISADEALGQRITTMRADLVIVDGKTATAQSAADAANAEALKAAGIADGKGKVIIQSAQPNVVDRLPQNLWIDTTNNANTPKRWSGTAWLEVTDKAAKDAAAAAAAAKAAADAAMAEAVKVGAGLKTEETVRANADQALASRIDTAEASWGTNLAQAEQRMETKITTVDGKVTQIGALWTAKVAVNGLIGGFGVYNDGQTVEAGFDVDRFWVGRTNTNKRKPFIIENDVVYIDDAAINKLIFSKLRDESGAFIVANGKVQAKYLEVDKIVVNEAQSANYVAGTTGWKFFRDGNFEINGSNAQGRIRINPQGATVWDQNGVLRVRWGMW